MSIVRIKKVEVQKYPVEKSAEYVNFLDPSVNLIDNGVRCNYELLDENQQGVFNGSLELNESEVIGWKDTDEQLVDAMLYKLNLERFVE